MTKVDLVNILTSKANVTKRQAEDLLTVLTTTITREVHQKGDTVSIPGLGTFKQKKVAERNGRNPSSGETIVIPAKTKLTFSPAPAVKK